MKLSRLRQRAAWGLWVEAVTRAALPAGGVLAAYLAASLFGLRNAWLFPAVLIVAAVLLGRGIATLRRPGREAVDRRIEHASGLRHRPIAMLEDAPENESEIAAVIWRIHQRRLAAGLATARSGRPTVNAAAHDPYALRGLLIMLLLAGAIIAGPAGLPRLAGAFSFPAWPFAGPSVNAWVTLPAYTGAPPLLLGPGEPPAILVGSRVTVVVNGVRRRPDLVMGREAIRFDALGQDSFRADAMLHASAKLRVGPWWNKLAAWNITVVPPEKPLVTLQQPVAAGHQLRVAWRVQDRYGVMSLGVTLMPAGHPGALPESLGLALNSLNSKDEAGVSKPDISDSPYAGLQVSVMLAARNLAGVTGMATPMTVRLPPADLQDVTAIALAALRQRLSLAPDEAALLGDRLQQLAAAPPSKISGAADVQMAVLARQLSARELSPDAAQKMMGMLVRQIEEGPDYQPAQALTAANQALEQALRQSIASGKPLGNARLQALLAALHEALARHLQALGQSAGVANAKTLNAGDLDRMAEQIAQDEASGQTAKAAAELNRLQQMLAALQSAKPMSAAQAARAAAADKAAQNLTSMAQGESALLDQTNQGKGTPGSQQALSQQLAGMQQDLTKAHITLPGLDAAAAAMNAAQGALTRQDIGTAMTAEGGAIQALQKAQAALAAGQAMNFGENAGPSAGGEDPGGGFGDGIDGAAQDDALHGMLPSSDNAAAAIQRQIIRDDDNPALPSAVHQYYHRLLNQDQTQP